MKVVIAATVFSLTVLRAASVEGKRTHNCGMDEKGLGRDGKKQTTDSS